MERPYGQIPSVQKKNACCFKGVQIEDLNLASPQMQPTFFPATGCDSAYRNQIYYDVRVRERSDPKSRLAIRNFFCQIWQNFRTFLNNAC